MDPPDRKVLNGEDGQLQDAESQRARMELALRESEEFTRLAMRAGRMFAFEWNPQTDEVRHSSNATDLVAQSDGVTRESGKDFYQRVHAEDRDRLARAIQSLTPANDQCEVEYRVVQPNGQIASLRQNARAFFDAGGEMVKLIGMATDITGRGQPEAAIHDHELQYKEVFDSFSECIFVLDVTPEGRFKVAGFNPAEERAIGVSTAEVAGKYIEDVLPEHTAKRVTAHYRSCVESGKLIHYEEELELPGGTRFFHTNLIPVRNGSRRVYRIIGCCTDLTDLKQAQQKALASQKLESLGVLAGGIAHDFNNLLGAILASSELALSEPRAASPVDDELRRISMASRRGSEVVRQLMMYAGNEDSAFERVDVSALVGELLDLLKVSISKHATLETELGRDLPPVWANAGQIRQAVLNIVVNASEALGDQEGKIRVRTTRVTGTGDIPEGDYVLVEVSDTGNGMTPEVQARIFDPFFTTKQAGRGLGLASVQGIVRTHGGILKLSSEPGRGSRFELLLPGTNAVPHHSRELDAPPAESGAARDDVTVLIAEDEDLLLSALSKMLRKNGFSVIETTNGSAALEVIRQPEAHIDVLFLDLTLPGTPSRQVFEEAKRLRPEMNVIVTSAYSRDMAAASWSGRIEHFIRKPYRLGEVMALFRQAVS